MNELLDELLRDETPKKQELVATKTIKLPDNNAVYTKISHYTESNLEYHYEIQEQHSLSD